VLAAAPLVGRIPLAALAGVLLATTVRMVEAGSLWALAHSTRGDALVLALTFTVTVAMDLVTAVAVGIGVAVVLALRAVARTAGLQQVPLDTGDHTAEERALLTEQIVAYRLDGPLFFAAAHTFLLQLSDIAQVRVVILRMSRVSTIDATGAHVLGDAINRLQHRGIIVLLSGVAARHEQVLSALGVAEQLRRDGLVFADTPAAIRYARTQLLPPVPASGPRPSPAGTTPIPARDDVRHDGSRRLGRGSPLHQPDQQFGNLVQGDDVIGDRTPADRGRRHREVR
jgi:SulP family sulfate permease